MTLQTAESPAQALNKTWKAWAAIASLVFSIYKLFVGEFGNAAFGVLVSLFLFFNEYPPRVFAKGLVEFFKGGDRVARRLLIAIAMGGTLLVFKEVFEATFFFDSFDFLIKRSAAPLVVATIVIYTASLLGKLTFRSSDIDKDGPLQKLELWFYLSVACFCLSFLLFCLGEPKWDTLLGHAHDASGLWIDAKELKWGDITGKVVLAATLISAIWMICFGGGVVSRLCEKIFRDDVILRGHVQSDITILTSNIDSKGTPKE